MSRLLSKAIATTLIMAVFMTACRKEPVEAGYAADTGSVHIEHSELLGIARVAGRTVSREMLEQHLTMRPMPDYAGDVESVVRERVEELILYELLYQEALRLGLDKEPDVQNKMRQILAQLLLDQMVETPIRQAGISEDEIRQYYDEHIAEFHHPGQRRLADIFLRADESLTADERREKRALAEDVLQKALEGHRTGTRFSSLIRQFSDKPKGYARGDTGFFDSSGAPLHLDPKLVQAAFSLEGLGLVHEQVVETADGFHIVMLMDKRAAVEQSLDNVRGQIARRAYEEKRAIARQQYIDSLKAKTKISVNQEVLRSVAEKLSRPEPKAAPGVPVPQP